MVWILYHYNYNSYAESGDCQGLLHFSVYTQELMSREAAKEHETYVSCQVPQIHRPL